MSAEHAGKPCRFQTFDRAIGAPVTLAPPVNCLETCARCGWNPKELKRRIAEGKWEAAKTRLNYETGEIEVLPKGTKRLVFRRG